MHRTALFAICLIAASAGTAFADSIDGTWCIEDGRSLSIDGPRIVTPGGTAMAGDYDRHGFSYVVPPSEPGTGSTVRMRLFGETVVHLTRSDRQGPPEVWRRCTIRPVS